MLLAMYDMGLPIKIPYKNYVLKDFGGVSKNPQTRFTSLRVRF